MTIDANTNKAGLPRASFLDRTSTWVSQTGWIALGLGVLIAFLVLPPIVYLIRGSLHTVTVTGGTGAFTFDYYRQLTSSPKLAQSSLNSLFFAAGSAVVALGLGGTLAWIVERTNAPFKALAYLGTIISLGTPYILYVAGWVFLFNKVGPFNEFYRWMSGSTGVMFDVYSLWGMILVEGFLWSPLVFLLLSAAFRSSNPEFEEAARMCGANLWDTITRITLKIALPAVLALSLLVFVRAVEGFEVPALIGIPGKVYVLTTDIYLSLRASVPPDMGRASAYSVVLLVVVAGLLTFYSRLSRNAERYQTVSGKGFRGRLLDLGIARWFFGGIIVLNFIFLLVLPMIAVLWASLLPYFQGFSMRGLSLLTLDNYRAILNTHHYYGLIWNTLFLAAAAGTVVMALTFVVGWLAVRRQPGGWILDQLATMPLIFPGIVLGTAVMQVWLEIPIPIYGTIWIILIAYVIRYLPYGMRYSYSGMIQIHRELEEAALVNGASTVTTLRRVVFPLLMPAMVSGWLFIFLLGARELSLPILLAGPDSQTIAVVLFDLWNNGQGTELAAMGLLWTLVMTALASVFYFVSRRSGAGVYG